MGGGVAIFDFDNDGWEDIYLTGGEDSDKLYRNLGNGQFENSTTSSGISAFSSVQTFGVTTGDIDNDGFRDILLTTFLGHSNILLHNNGNGTVEQIPLPETGDQYWSTAATFGDVNQDGFLDILITNYVYQSAFIQENGSVVGFAHECSPNRLYLNNGDLTFTDASAAYGVDEDGCALAVAFSDFDNDLDSDIILCNDFGEWVSPNRLFRNDFPVTSYTDVSNQENMAYPMYGMGVAIGDYDRDLDLDYYQTNIGRNRLSKNEFGSFSDVTEYAGVENDSLNGLNTTSWGTFFADLDNDGWQDLFVANGIIPAAPFIANVILDPNKLYRNLGDGTFDDVTVTANVGSVLKARGAAYGDLNKDGKLDIVVNNVSDSQEEVQICLYQNETSNTNNWLQLKLVGVQSNKDGFGAHVKIVLENDSWIQELGGGSSHASQNTSIMHFGIGERANVDSIIVYWPSGSESVLINVTSNQIISITEDVLTSSVTTSVVKNVKLIQSSAGSVLQINSNENETLLLDHIDFTGRLVKTDVLFLQNGINRHTLKLPTAMGIYLLNLRGHNFEWSAKIFHGR